MNALHEPYNLIALLAFMSLLPLFVVIGTSFLKMAIVFSLLRTALGVQQVPPNIALYGLSLIMTIFLMGPILAPVAINIKTSISQPDSLTGKSNLLDLIDGEATAPYKKFLQNNTNPKDYAFFKETALKNWPEEYRKSIKEDSLILLIPSFALTQLSESFKLGLLLFLPFLVIDLVVSNVLLAMGMMMVSPITISLPFKIMIFVMVDGWHQLFGQILASFNH
jgi:type III secretion protein R